MPGKSDEDKEKDAIKKLQRGERLGETDLRLMAKRFRFSTIPTEDELREALVKRHGFPLGFLRRRPKD